MSTQWKPGKVYLKTTSKEGHTTYTSHDCWQTDLFIRYANEVATAEGGKAELITQDEYKANR